jgi:hypothetical protein
LTSTCQIWPRYISWIRIWHFQFSLYISYKTTLFNKLYCDQINSCLIFIIFKQQRWYIRKIIIMGQEFTLGSFFLIYIYTGISFYMKFIGKIGSAWIHFSLILWLFFVFFTGERKICSIRCDFFVLGFWLDLRKVPDFLKILVPFKYFLQL